MWPFSKRPPEPRYRIGDRVWWQIIGAGRLWKATVTDILSGPRYVLAVDVLPGEYHEAPECDLRPRSPEPQPEKPA
jgi:hypothetical protein